MIPPQITDTAHSGTCAAPALAGSVSFPNVTDGATLGTPAALEFAVTGMDVLPANQGLVEGMFDLRASWYFSCCRMLDIVWVQTYKSCSTTH